ncbi:response regulator [Desulfospira joergensenii]|uniref:response regulator n=1 Tax=Desulfospira joergensenii TaxID=53329 RepID=UPI0003B4B12A|nr:response regulator [Desulfospira joergensenii]
MDEPVKTVLLVDDEINIRQSFADYFEDNLWETLQAENGEQALEILKTASPQGAIVDIRMGGMDGNAFIREAYEKNPDLNFIICTGSPEYDVPPDLKGLPRVSEILFRKPVADMAALEKTLSCLIRNHQKKE